MNLARVVEITRLGHRVVFGMMVDGKSQNVRWHCDSEATAKGFIHAWVVYQGSACPRCKDAL